MSYTADSIRDSIRIVTSDSIHIPFECKRPIRRPLVDHRLKQAHDEHVHGDTDSQLQLLRIRHRRHLFH